MFIQWLTKILGATCVNTHAQAIDERASSIITKVEATRQQVAQDEQRFLQEEEQLKRLTDRLERLTREASSIVANRDRVVKVVIESYTELAPLVDDFVAKATLAQELQQQEEKLERLAMQAEHLAQTVLNRG